MLTVKEAVWFSCVPNKSARRYMFSSTSHVKSMAPAQMVDKLRATPNFFRDAKRAHQAYEQQMQEAAAVVRRLLLETDAMPGVQLRWMRRPDPVKVTTPAHRHLPAS